MCIRNLCQGFILHRWKIASLTYSIHTLFFFSDIKYNSPICGSYKKGQRKRVMDISNENWLLKPLAYIVCRGVVRLKRTRKFLWMPKEVDVCGIYHMTLSEKNYSSLWKPNTYVTVQCYQFRYFLLTVHAPGWYIWLNISLSYYVM